MTMAEVYSIRIPEETIEELCQNPAEYCTTFGTEGSYYDHITDILSAEPEAIGLIDLSVTEEELYQIMKESGFKGQKVGRSREMGIKRNKVYSGLINGTE